jgi:hypothetical protein
MVDALMFRVRWRSGVVGRASPHTSIRQPQGLVVVIKFTTTHRPNTTVREPSSHPGAGCAKQADLAGGDRASTAPRPLRIDLVGAHFALERAWRAPGRQNGSAQNAGSIHDWVARSVETARISLKHMRRLRLSPLPWRGGHCVQHALWLSPRAARNAQSSCSD